MTAIVHLYGVRLDQPPEVEAQLAALLSPDERARAARFHFPRDRRRFTIARATLRTILARRLEVAPRSLVFAYLEHGKPYLAAPQPAAPLDFNLAHAGERMLLVLSTHGSIGVDLEQQRDQVDTKGIAARYFRPEEIAWMNAEPDRVAAFFRLWARKEAVLKAEGSGVAGGLHRYAVHGPLTADTTFSDCGPPRRHWPLAESLEIRPSPASATGWYLYDIPAPPGFAAAIASERRLGEIVFEECEPAVG